jgi:type IV pilus assembly protein PilW
MGIWRPPSFAACRNTGFSLVEALAALALGLFVIAAAVALHARASAALRVLDIHARMHETARQALAVIESDVRMAGFWGLAHTHENVSPHPSFNFPARCGGAPWTTAVANSIDGTNNRYLSVANCAASAGGPQPGADVLIVRRASARDIPLTSNTVPAAARDEVLLISTRERGQLFVPQDNSNAIPTGFPLAAAPGMGPPSELRSLLVHAYYVSVESSVGRSIPALRRKLLTGGPGISDEEIAPGVEDLQFRVGADVDGDGAIDSYFEPEAVPAGARAVCVQLWLRMRSVERSGAAAAFGATSYADRTWPASNDGFARMLVTKTIHVRNGRP